MKNLTDHKRLLLNAGSAALQVIVVGLIYFFLYRYLIRTLGPSQLGVWALVISTSSIANLANLGITSGLVKFVADRKATGDMENMFKLIFTAFLSVVFFFAILLALGYLGIGFLLRLIIDRQYLALAQQVLPYSLLCLFINEVGGVYTSILEGFQKNYIRNIIFIASSLIFLLLAFLLVPAYGLPGVVYAQVIQSAIIFASAFFTGTYLIKDFTIFKWNWDRVIFKQLIAYGSRFQAVSVLQMLYEPATKTLLTHFGGLPAVGYYEMASRLINQARALIVNANQVMIPVIAQASHNGVHEVRRLYARTMSVTLFINAPLICAVISFSSFISFFWIGHVEPAFIFPLIVLSVTMFFNVMCGPAYYSSLGEGKLNLLVYVSLFMALMNLVLGSVLGYFFKAGGVILAWGITFTAGSALLIIFYQRALIVSFRRIFSRRDLILVFAAALYAFSALLYGRNLRYSGQAFLIAVAFFLAVFLPLLLTNDNLKTFLKKSA